MTQYVNSRDSVGISIAKICASAKAIQPDVSLAALKTKLSILNDRWKKYEDFHHEVLNVTGDQELETQQSIGEHIEECYEEALTILVGHIESMQDAPIPAAAQESIWRNTSNAAADPEPHVHLPAIKLPNFHGTYSEWEEFKDLFTSLILTNSRISNAQKLHYLKSSVSGEAAKLLSSYTISDNNFTLAWYALTNRFENRRSITTTYLQKIVDASPIKSESPYDLRKLLDETDANLKQLQKLGYPTKEWDALITFMTVRKLDSETRRQWELQLDSENYPKWSELRTFIYNRCRSLELLESDTSANRTRESLPPRNNRRTVRSFVSSQGVQIDACPICQEQATHRLNKCPQFHSWTLEQRTKFINDHNRCFNCLNIGHVQANCRSMWRCTICRQPHHTMLHPTSPIATLTTIPSSVPSNTEESATTSLNTFTINASSTAMTTILPTALIQVRNKFGTFERLRALIDQGSQCSFITESAAQRLHLLRRKTNVSVCGIGQSCSETSKSVTSFQFSSIHDSTQEYECIALVIPKITCHQPSTAIDTTEINNLQGLKLADPTYYISNRIEVLLGADLYGILLKEGLRSTKMKGLIVQNTHLGWIISGPISQEMVSIPSFHSMHANIDLDINTTLRKFWEIEEVPSEKIMTKEEQLCEEHFISTHKRNLSGRYTVKLPFKQPMPLLGSSKNNAMSRFKQVEKRLSHHSEIRREYEQFMVQYEELGHMTKLDPTETINTSNSYYIPHHHIIKSDSSTTRLRVVFDASQPTATGVSLNECMMIGPTIQQDIISILLRWRTHKVAIVADIEKMYRQVLVSDTDSNYQRILYRSSPELPIQTYKLLTLTYGTASAPFLAIRCLRQLACDEEQRFPIASASVINDFYVDDVMSGADDISKAMTLQHQLIQLLKCGGFTLRKWSSNESKLLSSVPAALRESHHHNIQTDNVVKALGLLWYPTEDEFRFKVKFQHNTLQPTKRTMLSDASKFFDPMGWLAPIIIKMKIQLQHLWTTGLGWDEKLPHVLKEEWLTLQGKLNDIELIRIPRWTGLLSTTPFDLHGFCDASNKAYAAVVFCRTIVDDSVVTKFIIAKTRVAPVKTISIPRLELCSAVLLAKLFKMVTDSMLTKPRTIVGWTDSTIVLSWLKSHPSKWKCFVTNRTSEILRTMNSDQWRHVPTHDNPADCATRGLLPAELIIHDLWWNGPLWLQQSSDTWPIRNSTTDVLTEDIKAPIQTLTMTIVNNWSLIDRFSSIEKLLRVTAYVIRFTFIMRKRDHHKGHITAREMKLALKLLIQNVQQGMFPIDYNMKTIKPITGALLRLNPFLDDSNLLRVGGRLEKSMLGIQQIHPIILLPNHTLTRLLIDQAHRVTLHGGPQLVLYYLRKQYWIINGKKIIRKTINNCIVCFRHRVKGRQQLMGQLPSVRVTPSRPFSSSGVDYAGPINIKLNHLRGARSCKAYIAVFVCMAIKAIHLEAVTSLTSEAFIAAYKRFVSRRGLCANLYSDNGTNFVGANVVLKVNHQRATKTLAPDIANLLANDGTEWHFIPPYSPHFGGLWEAAVKSVKRHLVRVTKDRHLTFEELSTVLAQIEACLNSRPLCPVSADPNEIEALSPSHFLVGGNLLTIPEPSVINIKYPRRWMMVQSIYQQFWKQWSSDYLQRLQQRPKWLNSSENITPGQLVIVITDDMPPSKWLLGRIVETHMGTDGLVRVATVKCSNGQFKRPITKLCSLPFSI